jgi:hypothetical protein
MHAPRHVNRNLCTDAGFPCRIHKAKSKQIVEPNALIGPDIKTRLAVVDPTINGIAAFSSRIGNTIRRKIRSEIRELWCRKYSRSYSILVRGSLIVGSMIRSIGKCEFFAKTAGVLLSWTTWVHPCFSQMIEWSATVI